MDVLWINFLRIVHISAGTLWVGAAVVYLFFIGPSVKATAPAGAKFLQYFIARQKYPMFMSIVSALTILAGAALYWRDAGGDLASWVMTGPGLGFTIGAVVSIVVFILGLVMLKPRGERLGALGAQIEAAGGPPTPEQLAELQTLDKELHTLEWVDFILLAIALLTMATARYWLF
jgi:hypothetical protein